jgi:hypothetical protein
MHNRKFPVFGEQIPPMLGRSTIMATLLNSLTKKMPSHLSLVGPRYFGKSVILQALEARLSLIGSPYCAVVRWDLGHQTPRSDAEFMKLLCRRLGDGILDANPDYGRHLLDVSADEYFEISEVLDAFADDGQKVLMLLDGFDKPLSIGSLTRNLWDNLLELCRKPGFRLVTSSRKKLSELIRDEKSATSDFWGVFEGIVKIAPFSDQDVEDILSTLPDHEFKPGAKTELGNWTARIPPLFMAVLNSILDDLPRGPVDNTVVNRAASKAQAQDIVTSSLAMLWDDCPAGTKDLYALLVERKEISTVGIGKAESESLSEKGLASVDGNTLKPACRMLQNHVQDSGAQLGSMARLFGAWDDYRANIRGLLERRLNHISRFDDRLYRLVERAIDDIPDYPDQCLNNLTGIRDRALRLIWENEFGQGMRVPPDIVTYWTEPVRNEHRLIANMVQANTWAVPTDPWPQLRILGLLTGCHQHFDIKARYVTKDTYVLLDALHNFRNRAEHPDGQSIHLGVAVAALMACVELLGCLERELGRL